MKTINKYSLIAILFGFLGIFASCSEFEPEGAPTLPNLPTASDVQASVSGRTVTLSWVLPQADDITGIRISCDNGNPTVLPACTTTYAMKGQPMDRELIYTVKIEYTIDGKNYVSEGSSVLTLVPHIDAKVAYLLTTEKYQDLPDDDERAAAEWFSKLENAEFIHVSDLKTIDPDIYSVIWIDIDRVGLEMGWQNLPAEISSTETINALKEYSANGGSLYLSDMATQLTVPLGIVPDNMAPTLFGSGEGGQGDDVWVINPQLGWDFRDGSDQGYYDRTGHEIFQGITLEDPNSYGYPTIPLIGPGHREDHNCMWDCNIYGKGNEIDVIKNFEVITNSLVLATWGHVRDHCVAGLVDFYATSTHGHCVANGFSAYEWNQNSGTNPYQKNVELLTLNILNYLK